MYLAASKLWTLRDFRLQFKLKYVIMNINESLDLNVPKDETQTSKGKKKILDASLTELGLSSTGSEYLYQTFRQECLLTIRLESSFLIITYGVIR